MTQTNLSATAGTILTALIVGCSGITEVSQPALQQIIRRDARPFAHDTIPDTLLDQLAAHKVVIVGETHAIQEHSEFMAALVRGLYTRGFRQLLFEYPQMADWLVRDFVHDGGILPGWTPNNSQNGALVVAIRDFNRTLPDSAHFDIRGIDINLDDYGGATSFRNLIDACTAPLTPRDPVTGFLSLPYTSADQQRAAIAALRSGLESERAPLIAGWGLATYDAIIEMVEIESYSIEIRAIRSSDYDRSVRRRESVMKSLADRRIGETPDRTLINVGSTHAQKKRLYGTEIEWLGDYLVDTSPVVGGSAHVIAVTPARIIQLDNSIFNQLANSPGNEILRLMAESWPERSVYLPLDDPMFTTMGIPYMAEEVTYVAPLKDHFDALLLYPTVHRVPPD